MEGLTGVGYDAQTKSIEADLSISGKEKGIPPQLTIGLPVFNGAATIRDALDTLLGQTYRHFILVISDNRSSDGTVDICREYAARDARIRFIQQPENLGPAMNFRYVLFEARTPYFMWAAADDVWAPGFIERHIAFLAAHPDYVLSQSRVLFTINGQPSHLSTGTYPLRGSARENAARYFMNPADNSRYYGVFRTTVLQLVFPPRSFYGLDWAVAAGTLRFGRHNEFDDVMMLRDSSDPMTYERILGREHNFILWRIFPLLFMTKYVLGHRLVPFSSRLVYALLKANVYMHLRFGLYRWKRLADFYLESNRFRGSIRQSLASLISEVAAPGLGRRIGAARHLAVSSLRRIGHRLWRRLPLSYDRRLSIKLALFRRLPGVARRLPGFETWSARSASLPTSDTAPGESSLPLPTEHWLPVERPRDFAAMVSVIVVTNQDVLTTLRLLDSLARGSSDVPYEVILVDRGSPDASGLAFRQRADVVYLRVPNGISYAEAARAGVERAHAEHLVFLEAESVAGDGFLRILLGALDHAAMAGPQLRYPSGLLRAAGARLTPGFKDSYVGHLDVPLHPRYQMVAPTDFCPGGFAITRHDYDFVGGLAGGFGDIECAGAELALCLRMAGRRVVMHPRALMTSGRPIGRGGKASSLEASGPNEADWNLLIARSGGLVNPTGLGRLSPTLYARPRRLLYIDAETPAPDQNAGSIEALNLMKIFDRLGYRVTFVPESNFTHGGRYTEDLQQFGIQAIWYPHYDSVRSVIEEIAADLDVVVLCRASIAERYLTLVRMLAPRAKIVFNTVDMHFLRLRREAELADNQGLREEAEQTRKSEFTSIAEADATIVVSSFEEELIRKELPAAQVHVIPLVREIPEQLDVPGFSERTDIVFVGTYQHPPNRDAVLYFAKEVWPLVQRSLPDARFLIVGSAVTPEIAALAGNGIQVLGYVPDLEPLLHRCRVSVAPLRYGAGIKGKVGTALQAGLPTVATTVAVEGTPIMPGQEVIVADHAAEFAAAVVQLYGDEVLWRRLSRAGFDFVRREYSFEANVPRITRLLRSIGTTYLVTAGSEPSQTDLARADLADSDSPLYQPSRFWERLQSGNTRLLTDVAVLNFKRTVNNNYFQWLPANLLDPQVQNLLRHWAAQPGNWPIQAITQSADTPVLGGIDDFQGQNPFTTHPGYFAFYCFFVGLLWHYAAGRDESGLFERLEEPTLGNPLPVRLDGKLISQDLANSLIELCEVRALMKLASLPVESRIIEIGAGYGRLAYVCLKAGPCKYVIVDIPPALTLAEWYLGSIFPDLRVFGFRDFARFADIAEELAAADIAFLSMKQVELLPDGFCHVAVSISSLHEMRLDQIEFYKQQLDRLTTGCIYFKQRNEWHNPLDLLTVGRADFLMPESWSLVLDRRHPVQEDFCELGFIRQKVLAPTASDLGVSEIDDGLEP